MSSFCCDGCFFIRYFMYIFFFRPRRCCCCCVIAILCHAFFILGFFAWKNFWAVVCCATWNVRISANICGSLAIKRERERKLHSKLYVLVVYACAYMYGIAGHVTAYRMWVRVMHKISFNFADFFFTSLALIQRRHRRLFGCRFIRRRRQKQWKKKKELHVSWLTGVGIKISFMCRIVIRMNERNKRRALHDRHSKNLW